MGETIAIAWTDVVTAVAAGVTVLILLAAAFYARNQIKCNERTRQAQLLADLSRRWDEDRLTEARKAAFSYKSADELKDAVQKLGKKNDKNFHILVRLPDFFEALGILVNSSCLDKQLTQDLFGTAIGYYHEFYGPTIRYLREINEDEDVYKWFDDLAEKLKKPVKGDS
jgi:hypothetical protein